MNIALGYLAALCFIGLLCHLALALGAAHVVKHFRRPAIEVTR
jgi:hypothetical protein